MNKKCKVNWSDMDGASPKPKRLRLEKDETDKWYHCPIQEWLIMMDFKVREGAENMLPPSTVGSFTLTRSPIGKKSQIR